MNTKKLFAIGFAALMLFPSVSFAKNDKNQKADSKNSSSIQSVKTASPETAATLTGEKTFCKKLPATSATIQKRLQDKQKTLAAVQSSNNQVSVSQEAQREAKLEAERVEADGVREKNFIKLQKKAKTNSQKQALQSFQAAVDRAVSARRDEVKNALSQFQQGLSSIVSQHRTQENTAVNSFSASLNSALQQAQSGCTKNSNTARAKFDGAVKSAQARLESDTKAFVQTDAAIDRLEQIKKGALDKAAAEFKTAINRAKEDLKRALK